MIEMGKIVCSQPGTPLNANQWFLCRKLPSILGVWSSCCVRKSNLQEGSMLEWLVFKAHHQCRPSNTQIKEESTRFKWPECRRTRDMPDAYSSCLPGPRHMLRLPLLCHLAPSPLHPQPWTTNSDFLCRRCVETCGSLRLLRVHCPNHQLNQCGDPNKTMQAHHVQWHHSRPRHHRLH